MLAVFVLVATSLVACGSEQGRLLYSLDTNGAVVDRALAITPDGTRIVVGTWSHGDGKVYMLDGDGNLLWSFDAGSPVKTLAITPDGSLVAAGTRGGKGLPV